MKNNLCFAPSTSFSIQVHSKLLSCIKTQKVKASFVTNFLSLERLIIEIKMTGRKLKKFNSSVAVRKIIIANFSISKLNG